MLPDSGNTSAVWDYVFPKHSSSFEQLNEVSNHNSTPIGDTELTCSEEIEVVASFKSDHVSPTPPSSPELPTYYPTSPGSFHFQRTVD